MKIAVVGRSNRTKHSIDLVARTQNKPLDIYMRSNNE